jgi:hypothetical protein
MSLASRFCFVRLPWIMVVVRREGLLKVFKIHVKQEGELSLLSFVRRFLLFE